MLQKISDILIKKNRKILYIFIVIIYLPLNLFCIEGIEYKHYLIPDTYAPFSYIHSHSIHVVEIDPRCFEIQAVRALDNGLGRESVSSLAQRYEALAAINAGFFSIGGLLDGKPSGALKINTWRSLPAKPRGCIGWSTQQKEPIMDRILVGIHLKTARGLIPISGLNRNRKTGEEILFTPDFHKTTLTNSSGQELIVENGIVKAIRLGGSSKIPDSGFVISIDKESPLFDCFRKGDKMSFSIDVEPQMGFSLKKDWDGADYIVGGVPLLIKNGVKIEDFSAENITIPTFISDRKARTAIGLLSTGNWFFVVVDKTDIFGGLTLVEFSDLLLHFDCTDMVNLDGGGVQRSFLMGRLKTTLWEMRMKIKEKRE